MSKTNHQREFVARRFANAPYDYTCGKKGERHSIAGLKKFIQSRHRASVKSILFHVDEETDFTEVMAKIKFPSGRILRNVVTSGSLTWRETQGKV